jgi:murein DD-endopeptidase MepM/ murein hydrolase activator NlpD
MRKYFPIAIVLAAFAVFAAKDALFPPLKVSETPNLSSGRGQGHKETVSGERVRQDKPSWFGRDAAESDNVVHGTISRGKPFFVEMQKAGVSPLDIQNLVQATRHIFNFKKVQPGQKYSIYADRQGGLDSLKFIVDQEKILNVAKVGATYQTRIDTIPFLYERFVTQAVINQSIFMSLQGLDADPELANRLAAIFGWDIDFFKDIRKGDTFSILYEKKVYENGRTQLGDVLAARIVCQGHEHNAFRYQSKDGLTNYFDAQGKSLQKSLLRAPLEFSRVSSNFSYHRFHPVKRHYAPHMGVDYAAPYGTPIRATGDGTVAEATRQAGNGNYIKIRHNSRYETYYLHLSRFGKGVRAGARVSQGQVIGYVGSTGVSTGPHLDYRIKTNGAFVNPRTIQLPSKEPVPPAEMGSFDKLKNACLVGLLDARIQNETVCLGKSAPFKPNRAERLF